MSFYDPLGPIFESDKRRKPWTAADYAWFIAGVLFAWYCLTAPHSNPLIFLDSLTR